MGYLPTSIGYLTHISKVKKSAACVQNKPRFYINFLSNVGAKTVAKLYDSTWIYYNYLHLAKRILWGHIVMRAFFGHRNQCKLRQEEVQNA
jgi:hypothetical protein